MIALSSISLHATMLHMGQIKDHIHFELNKVLKNFNKTWNFFRLLPFSAPLLTTNQSGNQTSKVSSMLEKTAHVAYGTKTSQNQNHGHLHDQSCSYC